jgi:hypothetical protein
MAARFQFSLRLLLIAITLIGAMLASTLTEASWKSGVGMMLVALLVPPFFIAGAMYGRGWLQAFSAGALVPAFLGAFMFALFGFMGTWTHRAGWELVKEFATNFTQTPCKVTLAAFWSVIPVTGAACAFFRWMLLPRD